MSCSYFVQRAARGGMDLFRIFDCLNWVENMRVAIDAVVEAGKLAEGAICYTGDILDPARAKYSLKYYVDLAKELERAGCHILGLKDMAGLLKPAAATRAGQGAEGGGRPADPSAHPRHLGHLRRGGARRGRGGRRRGGRGDGRDVGHDVAALPRLDRRSAAQRPSATPASTPTRSASISFYWEGVRRAICRLRERPASRAPRKSICTKCPAASSPT